MAGRESPIEYRCPHCGEQITRLPDNHSHYTCPRCAARYYVMIDEATRTPAFVDQSAGAVPPPLGLPAGSIRALIALAMALTAAALVIRGHDVPGVLASLLLTIVGFYFGFRTSGASLSDRVYDPSARHEQPLLLPAGVIRGVLFLAMLAAGLLLLQRGRLVDVMVHLELFVILAGLVVGYYAGKVFRVGGRGTRALIGHVKGLLGLGMAVYLAWLFSSGTHREMPPHVVVVLCATISFYFGSRT